MKFCSLILEKYNNEDESSLGSTHILGCPDVPKSWNDDAVFFNDEVFLGQINLSYVYIDALPKKGILYFFFASESRPYRGIVRYTENIDDLERVDFNSEVEFDANLNQEYAVKFSNQSGEIQLLGPLPQFKHYNCKTKEVLLFKFNPQAYHEIDIFKNIDEEICYLIDEEDLKKFNFDKAHLSLSLDD